MRLVDSVFLLWFLWVARTRLGLAQRTNRCVMVDLLMARHARLHRRRLLTEGRRRSGWRRRSQRVPRASVSVAVASATHVEWRLGRRWRQEAASTGTALESDWSDGRHGQAGQRRWSRLFSLWKPLHFGFLKEAT